MRLKPSKKYRKLLLQTVIYLSGKLKGKGYVCLKGDTGYVYFGGIGKIKHYLIRISNHPRKKEIEPDYFWRDILISTLPDIPKAIDTLLAEALPIRFPARKAYR